MPEAHHFVLASISFTFRVIRIQFARLQSMFVTQGYRASRDGTSLSEVEQGSTFFHTLQAVTCTVYRKNDRATSIKRNSSDDTKHTHP
jgi:hypothetical protein